MKDFFKSILKADSKVSYLERSAILCTYIVCATTLIKVTLLSDEIKLLAKKIEEKNTSSKVFIFNAKEVEDI